MTTFGFVTVVVLGVILGTAPSRAATIRCSLKMIGQCISSNTYKGCLNYDRIIECIQAVQAECTGFSKQVADLQLLKYNDSRQICPEYSANGTCWIIEINTCTRGFFYHDDVSKYSNATCAFRRRNKDRAMACIKKVNDFCQNTIVTEIVNVTKSFMVSDIAVCNSPLYIGDKCLAADIRNCEPQISTEMSTYEYFAKRCQTLDYSIRCLQMIRVDCETKEQKEFLDKKMSYLQGEQISCSLDPGK